MPDYKGIKEGIVGIYSRAVGFQSQTNYSDKIYKQGDYTFGITAIDKNGNESEKSLVTVHIADWTAPATPSHLKGEAGDKVVKLKGEIDFDSNSVVR